MHDIKNHDDVIKWKHFPRYWPFVPGIHRSSGNSPHKGQWRRALMFSLICAWTDSWTNNGCAGDLRGYRAHNGVIVMCNIQQCAVYEIIYSYDISCIDLNHCNQSIGLTICILYGIEVHRISNYRKFSNIRRTKSQNLIVSRLRLQSSLRNMLKPSVKWRMKM